MFKYGTNFSLQYEHCSFQSFYTDSKWLQLFFTYDGKSVQECDSVCHKVIEKCKRTFSWNSFHLEIGDQTDLL